LSIESKILSRVAFEFCPDSPSRDVIVEEITGASVVVVVTGTVEFVVIFGFEVVVGVISTLTTLQIWSDLQVTRLATEDGFSTH